MSEKVKASHAILAFVSTIVLMICTMLIAFTDFKLNYEYLIFGIVAAIISIRFAARGGKLKWWEKKIIDTSNPVPYIKVDENIDSEKDVGS